MSMHALIIASSLTAILAAASVVMVLLQELIADFVQKPSARAKIAESAARQRAQDIARDWATVRAMPVTDAR